MGNLITIKTDGTVDTEEDVSTTPLDRLQEAVGGYIETVPYFDQYNGERCVAFCNEEGKLTGLAPNPKATSLWYDNIGQTVDDYLVGDIIIVQGADLLGNL